MESHAAIDNEVLFVRVKLWTGKVIKRVWLFSVESFVKHNKDGAEKSPIFFIVIVIVSDLFTGVKVSGYKYQGSSASSLVELKDCYNS